jgi:hypothetical protein
VFQKNFQQEMLGLSQAIDTLQNGLHNIDVLLDADIFVGGTTEKDPSQLVSLAKLIRKQGLGNIKFDFSDSADGRARLLAAVNAHNGLGATKKGMFTAGRTRPGAQKGQVCEFEMPCAAAGKHTKAAVRAPQTKTRKTSSSKLSCGAKLVFKFIDGCAVLTTAVLQHNHPTATVLVPALRASAPRETKEDREQVKTVIGQADGTMNHKCAQTLMESKFKRRVGLFTQCSPHTHSAVVNLR